MPLSPSQPPQPILHLHWQSNPLTPTSYFNMVPAASRVTAASLLPTLRSRLPLSFIRTAASKPKTKPKPKSESNSTTIRDLLLAAYQANPLKDAVKFTGYFDKRATIWTYSQLSSHVNALSTGMSHLNLAPNDSVLTLLPPDSPEYAVLLLACSQIGVSLVPLPPPKDPLQVDIQALKTALNHHRPVALFLHSSYTVSEHADSAQILATSNPIINALDPTISLNDAAGLLGFVPLTGRPFNSSEFPFLRHLVSTDDTNFRGAISFRSLLVYSGDSPSRSSNAPLLVTSDSNVSQAQLINDAKQICSRLKLSSEQTEKQGRLVTRPNTTPQSAATLVAAIMKQALWVTSADRDVHQVAETEKALAF